MQAASPLDVEEFAMGRDWTHRVRGGRGKRAGEVTGTRSQQAGAAPNHLVFMGLIGF